METITIYTYSELSNEAKKNAIRAERENVREYHMEAVESEYWDCYREFENIFDIRVQDFGQGPETFTDYAEYSGREYMTGRRLVAYLENQVMPYFTEPKQYLHGGRKRTSRITNRRMDCPLTGVYYDDEILQPVFDFLTHPSKKGAGYSFRDLMNDCITSLSRAYDREQDSFDDDEEVDYYLSNIFSDSHYYFSDGAPYKGRVH